MTMTRRRLALPVAILVPALLAACGDSSRSPMPTEASQPPQEAAPAASVAAAPAATASEAAPELKAQITEADLGVPLYPGAALLQAQSSRQRKADGSTVIGTFETADPPAQVAAFYRDQLGAREADTPLMEMKTDTGQTLLMLNDAAANRALQVEIAGAGKGARVQVTAVQFPTR